MQISIKGTRLTFSLRLGEDSASRFHASRSSASEDGRRLQSSLLPEEQARTQCTGKETVK